MSASVRAATAAVIVVMAACSRASRAPGTSMPSGALPAAVPAPRNGLEVVGWMRRAHPSRALRSLRFTLTTEHRSDPPRATQSLAYAVLPGKLRVEQMPLSARTADVRDRQRLTVFRAGKRVSTVRRVDLRSLLAFDVFAQNADTTIMWLDSARVRFGLARRDDMDGVRVWVVGALRGDTTSDQFWVDAEHWRIVRVIQRNPRDPREILDVRYTGFTELLEVPVPTRMEVWRDGKLAEVQMLSDFVVNPALPGRAFDLSRWRSIRLGD